MINKTLIIPQIVSIEIEFLKGAKSSSFSIASLFVGKD